MELETVKRALARRTPVCENADGALQAGVSLLVVPGPELLLIRRAEHPGDPWSGQIGLPGGTREAPDADLLATAVRETEEEIDVALRPESLLGRLDDFRPRRKFLPDVLIRPFVFALAQKPPTRCSGEVQYCLWRPVRALAASRCEQDVRLPDGDRTVDAYLAGEREIVWGITYRILSGFFAALELA